MDAQRSRRITPRPALATYVLDNLTLNHPVEAVFVVTAHLGERNRRFWLKVVTEFGERDHSLLLKMIAGQPFPMRTCAYSINAYMTDPLH